MHDHPFSNKIFQLYSRVFIYFHTILTHGSVRAAARYLRITPSALTRQIQNFEKDLGLPLFERHAHGMVLTQAGDVLSSHITMVVEQSRRLENKLLTLKEIRDDPVNIMIIESIGSEITPYIIETITRKYPSIRMRVDIGSSQEIITALLQGELDIGIPLALGNPRELRTIITHEFPLDIIVHPKHTLAKKKKVFLADCIAYPLIMPASTLSLYKILEPVFKKYKNSLNIRMESNSIDLMMKMAAAGIGIAFCSKFTHHLPQEDLIRIPVRDKETKISLGIYTPKDKPYSQAVEIVLAIVSDYLHKKF